MPDIYVDDAPIALGDGVREGIPPLKRTTIGERYRGMVVRIQKRDVIKDGEKVMNKAGKPSQEIVVTMLTMKSTMVAGFKDETATPEPGDLVRLIERGGGYALWIEATRALGKRGVIVGDVVEIGTDKAILFDSSAPYGAVAEYTTQDQVNQRRLTGKPGAIGMRGTIAVRQPYVDEVEFVKKAKAAHAQLSGIEATERPAAVGPDIDDF